jgi:hypothetical protein
MKNEITSFAGKMDGTGVHHVKQNKLDSAGYYIFSCVQNLDLRKKNMKEGGRTV